MTFYVQNSVVIVKIYLIINNNGWKIKYFNKVTIIKSIFRNAFSFDYRCKKIYTVYFNI